MLDIDVSEKLLMSGDYFKREIDKFEGIDNTEFKRITEEASEELLTKSVLCEMVRFLGGMISKNNVIATSDPGYVDLSLKVNIWPFKLDEETIDLVGRAIASHFKGICGVELIDVSMEELTPKYCSEHFSALVMYNYDVWMNIHAENFKICRIPDVTLFGPRIYFNELPTAEQLDELLTLEGGTDPFIAVQKLATPLVMLDLIPVRYFCIINDE